MGAPVHYLRQSVYGRAGSSDLLSCLEARIPICAKLAEAARVDLDQRHSGLGAPLSSRTACGGGTTRRAHNPRCRTAGAWPPEPPAAAAPPPRTPLRPRRGSRRAAAPRPAVRETACARQAAREARGRCRRHRGCRGAGGAERCKSALGAAAHRMQGGRVAEAATGARAQWCRGAAPPAA
eukprot:scaffold98681_cov75-Phaeocystis_antarctica.AAC.1